MRLLTSTLVLLGIFVLAGCKNIIAPEFKYIDKVEIEVLDQNTALLKADAILFNPNKNKIFIKHLAIDVYADDKSIASIDKMVNVRAKADSEFTVPLDIQVNLRDLKLDNIGAVLGLFGSGGQKIRYLGKIKVRAYGMPATVPVDYEDVIKFNF